jgi:hypothetical protein
MHIDDEFAGEDDEFLGLLMVQKIRRLSKIVTRRRTVSSVKLLPSYLSALLPRPPVLPPRLPRVNIWYHSISHFLSFSFHSFVVQTVAPLSWIFPLQNNA